MEKTYVMVKPYFANFPNAIEVVKQEIKNKELSIVKEKFIKYGVKDAQEHYAEHFRGSYENAKPFYKELEDYITSDKSYGFVIEGENAKAVMREVIARLRKEIPQMLNQEPDMTKNVLHGSDLTPNSEVKEIAIFERL